ncbi:MAG: S1 family peptidase [Xanthomonadaceae bacterium]|nr:S1 family peptidase [Xanthomonadaceae bacterium]
MSHSNFVDRKTLVSIAIAMATAALAGTAAANDVRTSIPVDMAAAMQRDLNLTAEQLPRFFKLQHETLAREAQARRAFGANFAGGWLERTSTGDFRYVVATAGAAKASLPGSEVRSVRHSLRQLEGTMARLDDIRQRARDARAMHGVQSWYVDLPTNSVVVKVQDGAMLRAIDFVAVSAANVDTVRFERAEGVAMPAANVIGGNRYGSGGGSCSIGFSVTRGSTKGFATAGHCGSAGTSVSIGGVAVGSVQGSSFPTNDRAWANVRSSDVLYGLVNRYNGTNVAVRGSTEYGVGTAVCRSGYASGWRCGTITANSVTVNYSNGPVYGLRQANACLTQGDSGGSWLAGNQAQGVSSGGQLYGSAPPYSNCSVSNPVSYYQRINPLLSAYGLSLVLG